MQVFFTVAKQQDHCLQSNQVLFILFWAEDHDVRLLNIFVCFGLNYVVIFALRKFSFFEVNSLIFISFLVSRVISCGGSLSTCEPDEILPGLGWLSYYFCEWLATTIVLVCCWPCWKMLVFRVETNQIFVQVISD